MKWFSDYTFSDRPESFGSFFKGLHIMLIILSLFIISLFLFLDEKFESKAWYRSLDSFFAERKEYASQVLQISVGAVLLVSWQADSLLMPKLNLSSGEAWIGWWQFITIFFLIFRKTLVLGSLSLFGLLSVGVYKFGFFYMLDYTNLLGIAYYLFATGLNSETTNKFKTPVLFITLGFSLYWLGFEKLYYPGWSNYLLELHPALTLGLTPEFFLPAAAFVELGLGYLILQGIFERPLAVVITLVFILTTLVFGKVEVIGHTLLHATLVVFLLEGKGNHLRPPSKLYTSMPAKIIFVSVSYLIITISLSYLYNLFAHYIYQAKIY